MGGPEVERLIGLLAKLPGFGPRSARRAALRLLQNPQARMLPLAAAMADAARAVRACSLCGNLDSQDPCAICADPARDRGTVCVVETVGDLWALERAAVHRGLYHVLGGTLSALAGTGPDDLNTAALLSRIGEGGVREVILALGATVDGATTAHWLTEQLRPLAVAVTRVAQGVPIGGSLDVLDDGTLAAAVKARRPFG
ncbi:MAG: recombination protein RecR [Acidisphaera sp.]|nr:recombination protein RecR [Acidisphaera sp.]MBV9811907.1 recombination protein RecR [Acetobacteraceae bacterium]